MKNCRLAISDWRLGNRGLRNADCGFPLPGSPLAVRRDLRARAPSGEHREPRRAGFRNPQSAIRNPQFALVAALAAALAYTPLARAGTKPSALPPAGVKAAYKFDRSGPRYQAMGLIIRNADKIAPLLGVGRNLDGEIAVTVPDLGKMGFLAGDKTLGKLTDTTMKAAGGFSAEITTFGVSDRFTADPNKFAAAEWLNRQVKPKIVVKIDSLTDWKEYKDEKGQVDGDRFEVTAKGSFHADANSVALDGPARVTFIAPRRIGDPHAIRVSLERTIKGASLGLTGRDAGDLQLTISTTGYARTGKETTKKVVEEVKETLGDGLDLREHPPGDLEVP